MVARCWRARSSVGAISAACAPASTAISMASRATTVLPLPTSPCSSRIMRSAWPGRPRSRRCAVFWPASARRAGPPAPSRAGGRRPWWRVRRRCGCDARTRAIASWLASSSSKASRARAGVHRREVGLVRPAHAPGAARTASRPSDCARDRPRRAIPAARARARRRRAIAFCIGRWVRPAVSAIDRLDPQDLLALVERHDMVGVRHLHLALVEVDLAAHHPDLAHRQQPLQIVLAAVEKDEAEPPVSSLHQTR